MENLKLIKYNKCNNYLYQKTIFLIDVISFFTLFTELLITNICT